MANPNTTLAFFSSDAEDLYKDDILRMISSPEEYVLHFRYEEEYISEEINTQNLDLEGQTALVFFVSGNDLSIDKDQRQLENHAIREVEIKKVRQKNDTRLVHFYLSMKKFVSCEIEEPNLENLPPNKFFSKVVVNKKRYVEWGETINNIQSFFPQKLFFSFKLMDWKTERIIKPSFEKKEDQCYYSLNEESKYLLYLSFQDTNENSEYQNLLQIESKSDNITSTIPDVIEILAKKDNRSYRILTHTNQVSLEIDYLNFRSILNAKNEDLQNQEYSIQVRFDINRPWKKSIFFATLIVGGIISAALSKKAVDQFFDPQQEVSYILVFCAIILGFAAATSLFHFFNKK